MATSAWFNYDLYMNNKLAKLKHDEPATGWTEKMLLDAFKANGFGGADGAERHFMQYGQFEDVAPNAFFNPTEYYRAKAVEYFKLADPKAVTPWQLAEIQSILKENGMSAWSHYQAYGSNEGVNPSNQFDSAKYMDMKLKVMQATDPTMTLEKLEATFAQYGYSALTHFLEFGGKEGEVQVKVVNGKIPAELSVDLSKQVEAGGTSGTVYPLTTGADTITGTALDDVINGFVTSAGTGDTLTAVDTIDGGAGTDTLNITVKTSAGDVADVTAGATITNVEIVNIHNISGQSATLDASTLAGLTNVNTSLSTGNVTITDLSEGVEVGMIGDGKVTTGNFTTTYADSVTKGTLNLMNGVNGGAVLVSGDDIADVTINSFGGENAVASLNVTAAKNITINAVTDTDFGTGITTTGSAAIITVKGTGAVDLGELTAGTKGSVDASANTGGVDVILSSGDQSFTGGVGSDTVNIKSLTLTTSSKLEGGSGDGVDTLVVSGSTYAAGAFASAMGHATGFEVLRLEGGKTGSTYDVSALKGATTVELGVLTNGAIGLDKVGNKLVITDTTSGNAIVATVTRDSKAASKDIDITLDNEADGTVVQFGATASKGLKLSGYSTATINSLGGLKADEANTLVLVAAATPSASIASLKIAGTSNLTLVSTNIAHVNVDATGFKDVLDYTFAAPTTAKTTIIGGDADDIFRTAGAFDYRLTLNGGSGDDTLMFTGTAVSLTPPAFAGVTSIEKLVWGTGTTASTTVTTSGDISIAIDTTTLFQKGVEMNFTVSGDKATTIVFNDDFAGDVKLALTTSAALKDTSVITGAGDDTVIITAAANTSGDISVATGAGDDTIVVTATALTTTGKLTIDAGAGKDNIEVKAITTTTGKSLVTFNIDAGDSTVDAYDVITGFVASTAGTAGMKLEFAGTASIQAAGALGAGATVGATGAVTFKDANMAFADKVKYLVDNVTVDHATVVFVDGGNAWVFNNDATGDSLVELAGLSTATGLTATSGANLITIA